MFHVFILIHISFEQRASSLRRELLVAGAGRERVRGPPVLEKEIRSTDLWRNPNYAIILNTEFVNIIGEPAKKAPREPQECGFVNNDDNLDGVISYRDVDDVRSVDRLLFQH